MIEFAHILRSLPLALRGRGLFEAHPVIKTDEPAGQVLDLFRNLKAGAPASPDEVAEVAGRNPDFPGKINLLPERIVSEVFAEGGSRRCIYCAHDA